jgi:hypothetical protein
MSDMRRREFITLLSGFVVATAPDPVCMKRRIGRRRAPLRFVKLKPGHKATSEELVAHQQSHPLAAARLRGPRAC